MSDRKTRQIIKISSLESARAIFLIIAGLAVRQALLFLLDPDSNANVHNFNFLMRLVITLAFLFTLFRFTHGVAVVYELEKKSTETSTTPSAKKVEQIFALFAMEGVFLFAMSGRLGKPDAFVLWTSFLLFSDLLYITVSKTLKDANIGRIINPRYWLLRWRLTRRGTAPQTHLQWAISDVLMAICLLATCLPRPRFSYRLSTGNFMDDWGLALSLLLIAAGICDYGFNYEFYFGRMPFKKKRSVFVCSPFGRPEGAIGDDVNDVDNIRQAQWYCRELFEARRKIPYAWHAFYPYFLNNSTLADGRLRRKCALQYLAFCDEIHVYSDNKTNLPQNMKEELDFAMERGLEIKFMPISRPPADFCPAWTVLEYQYEEASQDDQQDISQMEDDEEWKRVFVCAPFRPAPADSDAALRATMVSNIRAAQWICRDLIKNRRETKKMIAPFAPLAFYPYFTGFAENKTLVWLDAAIEMLMICDAIYVYTNDGLENETYITPGMRACIDKARTLGLEMKFMRIPEIPPKWNPQPWMPVVDRIAAQPDKSGNTSG
jgi:hypothetical protein